MHLNWHLVQKGVEAVLIFAWEHWLSKKQIGSTVELIINGVKALFKKGDQNVGPKV